MKIAITGARGRIGRCLESAWSGRMTLILLDEEDGCDLTGRGPVDAVVHLAVNFTDADASLTMLDHALQSADTRRFIYASSVTTDPHSGVRDRADYVEAKAEGERRCAAWVEAASGRLAIALRLGHFDPQSRPPHEHEAVRVTESGLAYWFERALSDEPAMGRVTLWTATGLGANHSFLFPPGRASPEKVNRPTP